MALTVASATWRAMGTSVRIHLAGPDARAGLAHAQGRIAELDARWSRFRAGSDVCRLDGAEGRAVRVHPETLELLEVARTWWQETDGRFDPTIADALVAAGYDRDLAAGHGPIRSGRPAPGLGGLVIDRRSGTAQVPHGVRIDLGGIGKGRAADLVADDLGHLAGGLVDLGGDLRVWGEPPDGDGWPIAVEDLRDGSRLALLGLRSGAVATSTPQRRCWTDGDRTAHHLIDPRTGRPSDDAVVAVTVVAGAAAPAEVLAKAAVISGSVACAAHLLKAHDVAAVVVPRAGRAALVGPFRELCWVEPREVA